MMYGLQKHSLRWLAAVAVCGFTACGLHAAPQKPAVKLADNPSYLQALSALDEGIPQVSIQKLNECLAGKLSTPDRTLANQQLAKAYLAAGRPDDALKILQNLPGLLDVQAQFAKARALSMLGRWSEACPIYHQLAAQPGAISSYKVAEAECLHAMGNTMDAIRLLEPVVNEKSPVTIRLRLADYYLEAGETTKCKAIYEAIQPASPTESKAKKYIEGRILLAGRHYNEALVIFEDILKSPEGLSVNLLVGATLGLADVKLGLSGPDTADNVIEDFLWQHPTVTDVGPLFRRLDQYYAMESSPSDAELQKWAAKTPPDTRSSLAAFYLAKFSARTQKPDKALASLATFIEQNPGHPLIGEAYLLQGRIYMEQQNLDAAVKSFETAMQHAPDHDLLAEAEMSCANAWFMQGEFVLAQNLYRSAAEHSDRLWQQAIFNSALSWLNQANYDKFWSDYKELSGRYPNSNILPELVLEEGLLQARSSDARAESTLRGFIQNFPNHPRVAEAKLALAEIAYLSSNQNLGMASYYLKAANDSPRSGDTPEHAEYLGIFLADTEANRDEEKVIKACKQFIQDHPTSPLLADVYMKLGQVYFRRGEWLNAETEFETLAHDIPASPLAEAALFLAGQSVLKTMNTDKALDRFEEVAKRNGPLKLYARQQQAIIKSSGDEKDAIILYDDILASKPDAELKFAAMGGKADIYFLLGIKDPKYFDQAIATYNALAALPDVTPYWRNQALYGKGRCFEKLNKPNDALAAFYDVIQPPAQPRQQNTPEYLWFYKAGFEAANILESQEQWKPAIVVYQKMVAAGGPRSEQAKDRLDKLRLQHFIWEDQ